MSQSLTSNTALCLRNKVYDENPLFKHFLNVRINASCFLSTYRSKQLTHRLVFQASENETFNFSSLKSPQLSLPSVWFCLCIYEDVFNLRQALCCKETEAKIQKKTLTQHKLIWAKDIFS